MPVENRNCLFSIYVHIGSVYLCHPSACANSVAQLVVVVMCNRSMMRIVSLLNLLWSLVEVHSQSFPYVSFMGQTSLANNSYVDISQVGRPDVSNYGVVGVGVQCVTDLATCCTSAQGSHRGDWYFPDGTRLPFAAFNVDTFGTRVFQGVELRRNSGTNSPTVGIYRCDIPTLAVHDDDDISVRDTVYVGLYTASGGMRRVTYSL